MWWYFVGPLGCKEDWGHDCGKHIMGLVLFGEEEDQLSLSLPSHPIPMSTHPGKIMLAPSVFYKPGTGLSPDIKSVGPWSQTSASRTIRNKFLCFISYTVCDILLWQPWRQDNTGGKKELSSSPLLRETQMYKFLWGSRKRKKERKKSPAHVVWWEEKDALEFPQSWSLFSFFFYNNNNWYPYWG